jgi:hypothetical protein
MCCGLGESIRMAYYGYDAPYQFYGSYPPVCLYVISFNYVTLLCFIAIGNIRITIECKFQLRLNQLVVNHRLRSEGNKFARIFPELGIHTPPPSRPLSKALASILPVLCKHLSGNRLSTRPGAINSSAHHPESVSRVGIVHYINMNYVDLFQ